MRKILALGMAVTALVGCAVQIPQNCLEESEKTIAAASIPKVMGDHIVHIDNISDAHSNEYDSFSQSLECRMTVTWNDGRIDNGYKFSLWKQQNGVVMAKYEAPPAKPASPPKRPPLERCLGDAPYYSTAASYRDKGMSPEQVFGYMKLFVDGEHSEQFMKNAVNTVYFNPQLSHMSPHEISQAKASSCIDPQQHFEPLK